MYICQCLKRNWSEQGIIWVVVVWVCYWLVLQISTKNLTGDNSPRKEIIYNWSKFFWMETRDG